MSENEVITRLSDLPEDPLNRICDDCGKRGVTSARAPGGFGRRVDRCIYCCHTPTAEPCGACDRKTTIPARVGGQTVLRCLDPKCRAELPKSGA